MRKIPKIAFALAVALSFLLISPINVVEESSAAPLSAHVRWGNVLVDGSKVSGDTLTAWIDGVSYGICTTTSNQSNFEIQVLGTDYVPGVTSKNKSGGQDIPISNGDLIIYRIQIAISGDRLFANEVDRFTEGLDENANLNFTSAQGKEINDLKIFKVYCNPASGNDHAVLKNTGASTITVNGNWLVKADGFTSEQDYMGWQVMLSPQGIAPGDTVDVDLGTHDLSAASGDLEIAWKDTLGNIAQGEWMVMDRVEWSSTLTAHNSCPSNTTLEDKLGAIPAGYHLERVSGGAQDTENCEADFQIVADAAPSISVAITSPAAGTSWRRGTAHEINWTISGSSGYSAFINISSDGGSTFSALGTQNPSTGTFSWSIPGTQATGTSYIISIDAVDNADYSIRASNTSAAFSIADVGKISYVSISPSQSLLIYVNTPQDFVALAYDIAGEPIASGVTYSWTVFGPVGAISPAAGGSVIFTAASAAGLGSVNVTAEFNGEQKFNHTSVEVTQTKPTLDHVAISPQGPLVEKQGDKVDFTATGYTADNRAIGGVAFSWSVSPQSLGTLSSSTGGHVAFTAGSNPTNVTGAVFVNGTYNGNTAQGSVSITVKAIAQISYIAVSPAKVTVKLGASQQFVANAFDASHVEITGVKFAWSVEPSARGNITQNGLFTASTVGNCSINASAGGKTGEAGVSVSYYAPWKLGYLTITPTGAENVKIGNSQPFSVIAYAEGNATPTQIPAGLLAGLFSWKLVPDNIGTLAPSNQNCTFTAKEQGSGTIIVNLTYNGVTKSVNATVSVQGRSPGFDVLGVFIAIGIAAVIVTVVRYRKRL